MNNSEMAVLTKREHFAALALQGVLANNEMMQFSLKTANRRSDDPYTLVAEQAVSFADELLKALEQ